jgi:hypothetical protein
MPPLSPSSGMTVYHAYNIAESLLQFFVVKHTSFPPLENNQQADFRVKSLV